jgi:hypothetical protein
MSVAAKNLDLSLATKSPRTSVAAKNLDITCLGLLRT